MGGSVLILNRFLIKKKKEKTVTKVYLNRQKIKFITSLFFGQLLATGKGCGICPMFFCPMFSRNISKKIQHISEGQIQQTTKNLNAVILVMLFKKNSLSQDAFSPPVSELRQVEPYKHNKFHV